MGFLYHDRIYGTWDLPLLAESLLQCPTLRRLEGIKQAGASQYAFPERQITRFEHSVGVYLLLRRLGASEREQAAGMLHDISHTAFAHTIDLVFPSPEHNYHESLVDQFLEREDILQALEAYGWEPADFFDSEQYTLLEQPLPRLCADRIDYSLRDIYALGLAPLTKVRDILDDLEVMNGLIVMGSVDKARQFTHLFARLIDERYNSPAETYLYAKLASAIRHGLGIGVLVHGDLLRDDAWVWEKLQVGGDERIRQALMAVKRPPTDRELATFVPPFPMKARSIDPLIRQQDVAVPLSALDGFL